MPKGTPRVPIVRKESLGYAALYTIMVPRLFSLHMPFGSVAEVT